MASDNHEGATPQGNQDRPLIRLLDKLGAGKETKKFAVFFALLAFLFVSGLREFYSIGREKLSGWLA